MSTKTITCLFCQSKNEIDEQQKTNGNCFNCGMALSKNNPEGSDARQKRFLPFFWLIVIFCVVMMYYLPR